MSIVKHYLVQDGGTVPWEDEFVVEFLHADRAADYGLHVWLIVDDLAEFDEDDD